MSFSLVAVPDKTTFRHRILEKPFLLRRKVFDKQSRLVLTLFNEDKSDVGELQAVAIKHRMPVPAIDHYLHRVDNVEVTLPFRQCALGVLLLYIALKETIINGGEFLYLLYPLEKAQGFYVPLGFYPDPDAVHWPSVLDTEHPPTGYYRWDYESFLRNKLHERRGFSQWRGNVNTLQSSMTPKVNAAFVRL